MDLSYISEGVNRLYHRAADRLDKFAKRRPHTHYLVGTALVGITAGLVFRVAINPAENQRIQVERDSIYAEARAIADLDDNRVLDGEEVRFLALSLNVADSSEVLTAGELEKRINRAPLETVRSFVDARNP